MSNQEQSIDALNGITNRVLRFTFSYGDGHVQLVSVQKVEMRSQPSEPGQVPEGQSGFWFELRDIEGKVLYWRFVRNPIRLTSEVFSNEAGPSISRVKIDNPRGAFELVVPEIEEAATIVLFSSPLDPAHEGEPARELARFPIAHENESTGSQS